MSVEKDIQALRNEIMVLRSMVSTQQDKETWGNAGWQIPQKMVQGGGDGEILSFSFKATKTSSTAISVLAGDVWLGPMTVVHWGDAAFTGESLTYTGLTTSTCIWLEIDVATPAVVMTSGTRTDMESALNATEQLTKMVWPLIEVTCAASVITAVKNLQCGDVVVPRAAG